MQKTDQLDGKIHPSFERMTKEMCTLDAEGNLVRLPGDHISHSEGAFIFDWIGDRPVTSVLEIGCAYGGSSLQIGFALSRKDVETRHVVIDPFQYSQYRGIGLANLTKAGFPYEFLEEPSQTALPELVSEGQLFDLVVIDGYHTFDHTLVDLFFAERLIDSSGLIVIDDTRLPPVNRAVRYYLTLPHIRLLGGVAADPKRGSIARRTMQRCKEMLHYVTKLLPERVADEIFDGGVVRPDRHLGLFCSMVVLEKVANDDRRGDWYRPF